MNVKYVIAYTDPNTQQRKRAKVEFDDLDEARKMRDMAAALTLQPQIIMVVETEVE